MVEIGNKNGVCEVNQMTFTFSVVKVLFYGFVFFV